MRLCTRNDLKYTLELIWESVLGINCAGEQTVHFHTILLIFMVITVAHTITQDIQLEAV